MKTIIAIVTVITLVSCAASKENDPGIPQGWVRQKFQKVNDSTYMFGSSFYLLDRTTKRFYKCSP